VADRVAEILAAAHATGDAGEFRTLLLRQFRDATGGDGAVFVPGADPASFVCFDHDRSVCEQFFAKPERYERESTRMAQAVREGRPYLDAQLFPDRNKLALYADLGLHSMLGCPLAFRGRSMGLILVVKDRADFDPSAVASAEALASVAAIAEAAHRSMNGDHDDDTAMRGAFARLTERERQVAQLLAAGMQNKEIASVMGTSPNTIRKQTVSIFGKLGLRGRTDVARWVERLGILQSRAGGPDGSLPSIRSER
jgi:DNA-binding CsgD family transcriptional regulator